MSDQRRVSQRKSTIENSQKIENILKEREIKAQKKNSKKLGSISQGQLKSSEEEAHEVIDLAESLPEDAALAADNIEIEESNLDPGSGLNLENQAQIVDPLGALTPGVIRSQLVRKLTDWNVVPLAQQRRKEHALTIISVQFVRIICSI